MTIETDIISIRSSGTPRFVKGKIDETDGKFMLSRKTSNIQDAIQSQSWEQIGEFDNLRDAIERSSDGDFFNRTIEKTRKLWPES